MLKVAMTYATECKKKALLIKKNCSRYRKAQQIVKLAKGQQIRLAKRCKKAQNWLVEDVEGGKQS